MFCTLVTVYRELYNVDTKLIPSVKLWLLKVLKYFIFIPNTEITRKRVVDNSWFYHDHLPRKVVQQYWGINNCFIVQSWFPVTSNTTVCSCRGILLDYCIIWQEKRLRFWQLHTVKYWFVNFFTTCYISNYLASNFKGFFCRLPLRFSFQTLVT